MDGASALDRRPVDGRRRTRWTSAARSERACGSGRSQTRFAGRSKPLRRPRPPVSTPRARPSCSLPGMPDKDYSGTPLSQKLGAKPGAGVVVFFTTSSEDLERRFEDLKTTLDPADGLWIAWPKKAAKIEGDLTFEAVQEIGLAHGLVDNKSCSIDERWQALRFVYRLEDRPRRKTLRARSQGSSSQRIRSASIPRASARSTVNRWKRTMSTTGCVVAKQRDVAPELPERPLGVASSLGRTATPSSRKQRTPESIAAKCPWRICSVWCASAATCAPFAELEHRFQHRGGVGSRAGDEKSIVLRGAERIRGELVLDRVGETAPRPRPGALSQPRSRTCSSRCGSSSSRAPGSRRRRDRPPGKRALGRSGDEPRLSGERLDGLAASTLVPPSWLRATRTSASARLRGRGRAPASPVRTPALRGTTCRSR